MILTVKKKFENWSIFYEVRLQGVQKVCQILGHPVCSDVMCGTVA